MINRPFAVRCLDTLSQGTLEVSLRFSGTAILNDDALRLIQRIMHGFVQVAANGGLAGSHISPADSTLSLTTEHITADTCAWKFDDVQIAPSARIVIENIIHFFHLNVAPISQLDIAVPKGSTMVTLQDEPPGLINPLPFQYLFEADAAEVVIDIDFKSPVDNENIRNQFIRFWSSWLYVSAAGGFETEDFTFRRLSIFPAGEPESHIDQISLFMEDVSVSDRAFDVLVNGFHKLHFTTAPLSYVHIY